MGYESKNEQVLTGAQKNFNVDSMFSRAKRRTALIKDKYTFIPERRPPAPRARPAPDWQYVQITSDEQVVDLHLARLPRQRQGPSGKSTAQEEAALRAPHADGLLDWLKYSD